jgi:hypothetical protein
MFIFNADIMCNLIYKSSTYVSMLFLILNFEIIWKLLYNFLNFILCFYKLNTSENCYFHYSVCKYKWNLLKTLPSLTLCMTIFISLASYFKCYLHSSLFKNYAFKNVLFFSQPENQLTFPTNLPQIYKNWNVSYAYSSWENW